MEMMPCGLNRIIRYITAVMMFAVIISSASFAESMTSTSYIAPTNTVGGSGSHESSPIRNIYSSTGQQSPAGTAESSSYVLGLGHIFTILKTVGIPPVFPAPIVTVEAPGLGAVLKGGGHYLVTWETYTLAGIQTSATTVEFSSNNGGTWSNVASNVNEPYDWTVNTANSVVARVRVIVRDIYGKTGVGTSTAFTVDSLAPQVTTTDPVNLAANVDTNTNIVINFNEPMNPSSVVITTDPALTPTETWNGPLTQVTYDPGVVLATNQKYLVTVEGTAEDLAGNQMGAAYTLEFTTGSGGAAVTFEVRVNGRRFVSGDILPPNKQNVVEIRPYSGTPITSCEMYLDGDPVTLLYLPGPPTPFWWGHFTIVPHPNQQVHEMEFIAGNSLLGVEEVVTMETKVLAGGTQIVGPALNYPNPFMPMSTDPGKNTTRIQYILSNDDAVTIVMFNIIGEEVKRWTFAPGAAGGRAGVNSFTWNGRSMINNVVGNGMYIYVIYANGNKIGTGKIVVLDKK